MLADAMNQHSISDVFFEKLYASLYPFRPAKWIPPFKKTQRTPARELKIARKQMKEVRANDDA